MMAEQRDAMGGLQRKFVLALPMIFALLAVPLRSYVPPLIILIMTAARSGSSGRSAVTSPRASTCRRGVNPGDT